MRQNDLMGAAGVSDGGRGGQEPELMASDIAHSRSFAPQVQLQDVKLAMKIGGEYRL